MQNLQGTEVTNGREREEWSSMGFGGIKDEIGRDVERSGSGEAVGAG